MKAHTDKQKAMEVSVVSIIGNVLLSAFKLFAGIFAKSSAMISDSIHSMSDVFSTFVVMAGVNIADKKPDREHPYGHDRMECIAAIILSAFLAVTGFGIGWTGIQKIIGGDYSHLAVPGTLALVAAVVSIAVKEGMYWYTRRTAKEINSDALMADAWHHRSDALSSIGSFAGILGAKLGFPICDPIASVIICIFILKAAYTICKEALDKMVDKSCDQKTVDEMTELITAQADVLSLDEIKTRMFGSKIYVDVEIGADEDITLKASHEIAQRVHDAIESSYPRVKHCMVHVNPVAVIRQIEQK